MDEKTFKLFVIYNFVIKRRDNKQSIYEKMNSLASSLLEIAAVLMYSIKTKRH